MSVACMLSHPASGHINPTLPVISELVRHNERVVYYATEPFRARVEATGACFRSYGDHELFERNLGRGGMLGGMAGLLETTEAILPNLLDDLRGQQADYLLLEAHAIWGNLASQVLQLPTATMCAMFAINEALISTRDLLGHLYGSATPERAMEGLQSLSRYFEISQRLDSSYGTRCPGIVAYLGNPQELNLVFTSREFQMGGDVFTDEYAFVGPTIAELPDDGNFPFDHLDGRPLLLISMGTMFNDEVDLYHDCFEAFAGTDFQVVMAVGQRLDAARLARPPDNFIVAGHVPQIALLRRAALFITHGGINSAQEAMVCGVPMIVLPQAADHFVVAQRVEAVGAGVVLHRPLATAARLSEMAGQVLGEASFQQRSARIGASLTAGGGHVRAADAILALKRAHGL